MFSVSCYKDPCPKAQLTVFAARPNVDEVPYLALPIIVDATGPQSGPRVEAPTLRFILCPAPPFTLPFPPMPWTSTLSFKFYLALPCPTILPYDPSPYCHILFYLGN